MGELLKELELAVRIHKQIIRALCVHAHVYVICVYGVCGIYVVCVWGVCDVYVVCMWCLCV